MKTTTPQSPRPALRWLNRMAVVCAVLLLHWLGCLSSRGNDYQVNCDPAYYSLREGSPPTAAVPDSYSGAGAIASFSPQGGRNLVFIFALPVLASNETIVGAALRFTISAQFGSPGFNADLWGIGFQTNTTPLLEYFEADTEDNGHTKLQDNLITLGMSAGQVNTTNAAGMAAYLQGFYTSHPGYAGGAYVFLRLNPDANAGIADVGWAIGMIHVLAITTAAGNVLSVFPQPADYSVALGVHLTNSCLAVGGVPPYTYQWWHQGALMVGETNAQLALPNVQTSDAGSYWVIVQDAAGHSTTSRVATLAVDQTFSKIMTGPIVEDTGDFWYPAWGDYDNDGLVDLLVCNGAWLGDLRNALYRNLGNGNFQRVTTGPITEDLGKFYGANWGDFNNDGSLDLWVGNRQAGGANLLYLNVGEGVFIRITLAADVGQPLVGWLSSWIDYDLDGTLDLFFAEATASGSRRNRLFHGDGNGNFTSVVNPITMDLYNSDVFTWADYDNNGRPDLLISAHAVVAFYRQETNGTFTRITSGPIATKSGNASGSAWGDYDNDGLLDLFLGDYTIGRTNLLFHNLGNGEFETIVFGLSENTQGGVWGDFDNDGLLDLFVMNSSGYHSLFYRNLGNGRFRAVTMDAGIASGCAVADYDNDGCLDLIASNGLTSNERNFLYHNNGNTNRWLMLRLVGTASNRSALGAKARVHARIGGRLSIQMREQQTASLGQNDFRLHFGLGDATNVDLVRIEWPSGIVQELTNIVAGQFLTITEPVVGITAQPADQVAYVGGSVTNFAEANGAKPPIDYQWYFNGTTLPGAIWPTLIVSNIQPSQAGAYYCVARDDEGNYVTSRVATVTVELPSCQNACLESGAFKFALSGNIGDRFELLRSAVVTPPPPATNWVVIQTITLTNRTAVISDFIATDNKNFYLIRRVP